MQIFLLKRHFIFLPAHFRTGNQSLYIFLSQTFPEEKYRFYRKSGQKEGTVQKDLQKWHVLINKINIISGRILCLKNIVPGTAGSIETLLL